MAKSYTGRRFQRFSDLLPNNSTVIEGIGEGKWLITLQPNLTTRSHNSFLNSYSPEDEGLYDDYTKLQF
jgi:hypothetical protein